MAFMSPILRRQASLAEKLEKRLPGALDRLGGGHTEHESPHPSGPRDAVREVRGISPLTTSLGRTRLIGPPPPPHNPPHRPPHPCTPPSHTRIPRSPAQ